MTTNNCKHERTVWAGWTSTGYVHGWRCLDCQTILVPKDEDEGEDEA